jgi:glycolate oxidase iron-sulfur subunit
LADRVFRAAIFHVLPHPARLRLAALPLAIARMMRRSPAVMRWLPARLRALVELAPAPRSEGAQVPALTAARGEKRRTVGLLTGCVQRVFFADVNAATVRVLSAEGCEVKAPPGQGCCGALALHAGRSDEARACARATIRTFEDAHVDQVVVNAAGCGSTMKSYAELLKDDPAWAERARQFSARVRDASETLAELGARAPRQPVPLRAAYHDACHLAHAQGVRTEPRALLQGIPGVTVVPLGEADLCCGSAGIFNLVQPAMASTLGDRKLSRIVEAEADVVVTSNPGCLLQMQAAARRRGVPLRVLHLMEILDRSISGRDAAAEPAASGRSTARR